jgi:hypothetical protein
VCREHLACARALESEHRVVSRHVPNVDVEPGGVLGEPGEVTLVVGGVRNRQVTVVGEAIGEEVVEHAAVLAAEDRVLRPAHGEFRDVVREHTLEELLGVGPARLDLTHVGHVEHTGAGSHRHMLLADALVLHRHLPTRERNEARVCRLMAVEERGSAERLDGGRQVPRG